MNEFWVIFCLMVAMAGVVSFLYSRMRTLENRLSNQEKRVDALANRPAESAPLPVEVEEDLPPMLGLPPVIPAQPAVIPSQPAGAGSPRPLPEMPKEVPAAPPPVEPEPVIADGSLEVKFGRIWLVRIGVLFVLTGLVYLAHLGYQGLKTDYREFIPHINAGLLYLVSFGLMAAGLIVNRRSESLKNFSEVLTGGGMAAVYFSTFALYRVKDPQILGLIEDPFLAAGLLAGWAAFIMGYATWKRSEVTALFAVAGAFYASYVPLIYAADDTSMAFTFASNIALALAAVFFVLKNRWANLSFLALFTSYAGFAYWRLQHAVGGEPEFWRDAMFLGAFWILFSAAGFLSRHGQLTSAKRAMFLNLNNAAGFGLMTLSLLQVESFRGDYWLFPMTFGPVLLVLFALAKKYLPAEKLLGELLLAKAATLVTLALVLVNVEPAGQYRSLLLAAECITLLFLGLRTGNRLLQYASAFVAFTGAAFVGTAITTNVARHLGAFHGQTLAIGLGFGGLLLAASWVAKRWEGIRDNTDPLRALPNYLATLGLTAGLITCLTVTAREFPASTAFGWAAFGLLALATRPLHRVRAITIFGEIYLFGGLLMWLTLGFAQAPGVLEPWNPAVMLALFALAQQWHQRQEETEGGLAPFLARLGEGACVTALGLIAIAWTHRLLDFDLTHAASAAVVIGLIFAAYSWALRSGQLFTLAQVFLLGAPVIAAVQILPPEPVLTWQLAMIPLLTALANGLVLVHAHERLTDRLDLTSRTLRLHAGFTQGLGVLAGLVVALEFVPLGHQLWALPLTGIALSTFCLGARLLPGLLAAQAFLLTAAGLAFLALAKTAAPGIAPVLSRFVPDAVALPTLVSALALLGMSHFLLHARDLFEESQTGRRQGATLGNKTYFCLGWTLVMMWAFEFVRAEYIFPLFTLTAIIHGMVYFRHERLERAAVAWGFFGVGFTCFWLHTTQHWTEPRVLDLATLLLLLGTQWAARRRDRNGTISRGAHIALLLLVNFSLWQWIHRLAPERWEAGSWGLLAVLLVGLGLGIRERVHRLFGLGVLLATMIHLTWLAASHLTGVMPIITFIGLGVLLIVLGSLYIKFQDKLKEYL